MTTITINGQTYNVMDELTTRQLASLSPTLAERWQNNDVATRCADGESWAGLARAYGMTQTTLMAAYARQTAAKRQE